MIKHPCFDGHELSGDVGRVHIPLISRCNIKCYYCSRKTHCSHESRPGVSNKVVSVDEGLSIVESLKSTNLKIIGLAGPGDPFSDPDKLFSFIRKVREEYGADYEICISSNGLVVHKHIAALKKYSVNYMTLTINAAKAETYAELVDWIIEDGVTYTGVEAGRRLLDAQLKSLSAVIEAGIKCKINAVIVPDVNQYEILELLKVVKDKGAVKGNLIPLIPVDGTRFENTQTISIKEHELLIREAENILSQAKNCRKCRADAVYVR